jgi:RimJ/RimL family protein N-acetyltransferase
MQPVHTLSLTPLSSEHHGDVLQAVYQATPSYWEMYNWPGVPAGQANKDLQAVAETPGRSMLGIVRRLHATNPNAGAELVGLVDFRLHWPAPQTVYIGMVMVGAPWQRQGIGTKAWRLLEPWLKNQAHMEKVRLAVEQFNHPGHQFFAKLGFQLTGESNRLKVGEKFVRLLYMEKAW